jgi:hypothetical protein
MHLFVDRSVRQPRVKAIARRLGCFGGPESIRDERATAPRLGVGEAEDLVEKREHRRGSRIDQVPPATTVLRASGSVAASAAVMSCCGGGDSLAATSSVGCRMLEISAGPGIGSST